MKNAPFKLIVAACASGIVGLGWAAPSEHTAQQQRDTAHFANVAIKVNDCRERGLDADLNTGACTMPLPAVLR